MQKQEIIDYYDNCESDYRFLWHMDDSLSLHYGYFDNKTKDFRNSLQRFNEILAEICKIKKSDKILDAGCGVGGSSIFFAKRFGCNVVGITLCKKQVEIAKEYSKRKSVSDLIEFYEMDYEKTDFKNCSFDVVFALESACYSDKEKFIKEAYRLLKKKGRLIIADGFAIKDSYSKKENILMRKWLDGWKVNSLETFENFSKYAKNIGFKNIFTKDVTKHVMPSSKRLYYASFPAYIVNYIGILFGKRNKLHLGNTIAAHYQYITIKKRLWKYGIFYAEKK